MSKKFQPLDYSRGWDDYWRDHPEGYSPQEQMINWSGQLNEMIDYLNRYFDINLSEYSQEVLEGWLADGTLTDVINEALFNSKADQTDLTALDESVQLFETQTNSRLQDIVLNVKTFGAKGDGVTDDSDAILSAIAAIPPIDPAGRNGGAIIYFPPGVYMTSKTIMLAHHNTTLKGAGSGASEIKALAPFTGTELIKWTRGEWHFVKDNVIKDLWIDCNGLEINGVLIQGWYDNCNIRDVNIRGFKNRTGLIMEPDPVGGVTLLQGMLIEGIEINPFQLNDQPVAIFTNLFESSIINSKFWNTSAPAVANSADVVHIQGCRGLNIIGGAAAAGLIGYRVKNAPNGTFLTNGYVSFVGVTIEGLQTGILLDGDPTAKSQYLSVQGIRPLTTAKHVIVGNTIGAAINITGLGPIDILAGAQITQLYGMLTGGPITNNGLKTIRDYYVPATDRRLITNRLTIVDNNELSLYDFTPTSAYLGSPLSLTNQPTSATSPSAGGAGALPATPTGYITVKINGVDRKIAYY